ncbi:hypothetical protein ACHAXR_008723 [Thalassiosira sp. AJA248-18]
MCKELDNISQGYGDEKGTNTVRFLTHSGIAAIPADRTVTYTRVVVDYREPQADPNRAKGGHVFMEIRKGMYGLPQSGILANKPLKKHLAKKGYFLKCRTPPDYGRYVGKTLARYAPPPSTNNTLPMIPNPSSFPSITAPPAPLDAKGKKKVQHVVGSFYGRAVDMTIFCALNEIASQQTNPTEN